MKRVFDVLAYSIAGLALAAGAVYGLSRLLGPAPLPPVPALPAEPVALAPAPPALPVAAPAPAPPPPNEPPRALEPAAPPRNAARDQDQATFQSLQRNCYEAASNNRNGEYPTLQTMACDRYQQFARAHGFDAGPLPDYGQAAPRPAPPPEPAVAEQPPIQDQPQVIYLAPGYGSNQRRPGHRRPDQMDDGNPPRPVPIGPNQPLPHPQQPPPVSQEQRPQNN